MRRLSEKYFVVLPTYTKTNKHFAVATRKLQHCELGALSGRKQGWRHSNTASFFRIKSKNLIYDNYYYICFYIHATTVAPHIIANNLALVSAWAFLRIQRTKNEKMIIQRKMKAYRKARTCAGEMLTIYYHMTGCAWCNLVHKVKV